MRPHVGTFSPVISSWTRREGRQDAQHFWFGDFRRPRGAAAKLAALVNSGTRAKRSRVPADDHRFLAFISNLHGGSCHNNTG